MSDFHFWLLFLTTAVALNAAPGPDLLYVMTKTIRGGKRIGFASSLGVCCGALFHVAAASLGLSAILVSSAVAFNIVKYIGVIYLLYLALQSFRSSGFALRLDSGVETVTASAWSSFKQGMMIDIFNPKVAIFFMAFLPQFVRHDTAMPVSMQLFILGLIIIVSGIIIEGIYIMLAHLISARVRKSQLMSRWLDRVLGCVFAGLGIKLALSSR